MSITERKLADGSTVYDVREYVGYTLDGKPDRMGVTCRTRREAEMQRARLAAMREAKRNRSGRMTFGDYVDLHWWPAKQGLANSTLMGYERDIRLRLRPAFGDVDIRDIDRVLIQRMVDSCPTWKVARNALDTLRTILNDAIGDRLIDANPTRASYRMPPKSRKPEGWGGRVITRFDAMPPVLGALRGYSDANPEEGPSCELNAMLGLLMGMRPSERLGLEWPDVDLARGTAMVRMAYVEAPAKVGGTELKGTKTEVSTRLLPMPARVRARMAELAPEPGVGPVIAGPRGGNLPPQTMRGRWARFLSWCGREGLDVPRLSLESMRHSFATSYLHAEGNVEDLSRILGHSDINTTYRRYVRPAIDDLAAGMEGTVDAIIG